MLTPSLIGQYREYRRTMTAQAAWRVVRDTVASDETLFYPPDDVLKHAPYGDDYMSAYEICTAGALEHLEVDLPAGTRAALFIYADDSGQSPDDFECYSAEDIAAWKDDRWQFVGAAVVVWTDEASEHTALWGMESGDYWPGADTLDVLHSVGDLLAEALGLMPAPEAAPEEGDLNFTVMADLTVEGMAGPVSAAMYMRDFILQYAKTMAYEVTDDQGRTFLVDLDEDEPQAVLKTPTIPGHTD